jgi:hypothetical protein
VRREDNVGDRLIHVVNVDLIIAPAMLSTSSMVSTAGCAAALKIPIFRVCFVMFSPLRSIE